MSSSHSILPAGHSLLGRTVLSLVIAAGLTACGDDIVRPGTAGSSAFAFVPRHPLIVDVDQALDADSMVTIATPEDTERIRLRPYPSQCYESGRGPECDVVSAISPGPAAGLFFQGNAGPWHATVMLAQDPRRALVYVAAGRGGALMDTLAPFVSVVAMTEVRCGNRCSSAGDGARMRLHAALPTSDAIRPGMSLVYQPVRTRDGVLHVQSGEAVTMIAPDGDRTSVTAAQEGGGPAPEPSNPWGAADARTFTLTVRDTQQVSLDVPFRLTNRTASTVYVRPMFAWLERWSGRDWQFAWGYGVQEWTIGPDPTVIAPGASVTGTVHATHLLSTACYPCFEVDPIPGTYRLGFDVYRGVSPNGTGFDYRDPLPYGTAVSNTFTVAAP